MLVTGTKPDLDNVEGSWPKWSKERPLGYKDMTEEDALAIADYLLSVPPTRNKIE